MPPTVPRSSSEISHSIAGQPVGTAEWAGGGGPIHSRVDGCPHRELGIIVWLGRSKKYRKMLSMAFTTTAAVQIKYGAQ